MAQKVLKLKTSEEAIALYGNLDENLKHAQREYSVRISAQNKQLKIIGEEQDVEEAYQFFIDRLEDLYGEGSVPVKEEIANVEEKSNSHGFGKLHFLHRGKIIRARSKNQARYLEAIRDYDLVFGIGPAGTGKTYLAMAAAIDALKRKHVSRIILTRPAVEAGENLGFLPGDLQEKVNPYLRPLFDALHDMVDAEEAAHYIDRGVIEVAPLAYMRGRTLSDAFIILDEGQNTTPVQMKMFLTRLGERSKAVVTGDITQIDLAGSKKSGLLDAKEALSRVGGLKMIQLTETDVVRHPLVQAIITAYDRFDRSKGNV